MFPQRFYNINVLPEKNYSLDELNLIEGRISIQ